MILLGAISKTGQGSISHEARQEYIRAPADRLFQQPNAGGGNPGDPPAGARSLSNVQTAFAAMWDAAVHDLAIHPRPKVSRGQGAKRGEKESKRHHGSTEQQNTTVHVPCGN